MLSQCIGFPLNLRLMFNLSVPTLGFRFGLGLGLWLQSRYQCALFFSSNLTHSHPSALALTRIVAHSHTDSRPPPTHPRSRARPQTPRVHHRSRVAFRTWWGITQFFPREYIKIHSIYLTSLPLHLPLPLPWSVSFVSLTRALNLPLMPQLPLYSRSIV